MTELEGNETYSVGENLLEGWSQLSLVCEDGDDAVDHPVALANGQHVTCVITNGEIPTVTVEKITDGEDEATFEFSGDLGDFSFDENGGSQSFEVDPGEYVVTETAEEFWSLTDVSCSDGASGDLNSASGSFDVSYGDHQTCTFTNVQLPKTIEVIAEGVCDGPIPQLKWVVNPINFNGTSVDITWLDIDAADPLYQQLAQPLQGVMDWPGIVVEDGRVIDWPGWTMVDGKWVQGPDGYEGTVPTAEILFSIDPDLIVMVDYADCSEPAGQIIVEKQVEGESPQDFAFTFTATGFTLGDDTLAHGDSASSGDLAAGDGYGVSEAIPSGWEQVSAVCDDGSDPTNIELSAGEVVTCTFTNNLPDEVEPIEVLPFTGLDSDVLVALAIVLAMAGGLALLLTRKRGRHEGLDR